MIRMYSYLVKFAYVVLPYTLVRAIAAQVFPYKVNHVWNKKDLITENRVENIGDSDESLYSQNGEDGVIRYIFSKIGFQSKTFLEFGFSVLENNSLRLVLKEGFNGLYIDGNKEAVDLFNKKIRSFGIEGVRAIECFLSVENLEETILVNGLKGDIDLLSIDVDGNDYWFWEAIESVSPRVVVMEYNASYGDTWSATVVYDEKFDRIEKHLSGWYHGASLTALEHLGKNKGYDLVYCEESGVNAFFVRSDCNSEFKILSAREAYHIQKARQAQGHSSSEQLALLKSMTTVEIP
jgi:hypothetical protein